jgi:hypothetical protein
MDFNDKQCVRNFRLKIEQAIEGDIKEESSVELDELLRNDSSAREYFLKYILVHSGLRQILSVSHDDLLQKLKSDTSLVPVDNLEFWEALAEAEDTAASFEIDLKINAESEEEKKLQSPSKIESPKRTVNKFSLFTAIFSTAALLMILISARFFSDPFQNVDVATIVDQVNVKWGESNTNPQTGDRLWTGEKALKLDKGIVKIHHDEGVDILIEGPTVFEIERSGIYIEYGQLFSHVYKSALGFKVETPTSRFIDHGTEFGVLADADGSSELHVIKGKVQLFAGSKGSTRTGQMVSEDKAVKFNVNSNQIKTIPVKRETFARKIDNKTGAVWRGEQINIASTTETKAEVVWRKKQIDLASIIAGGNGFNPVFEFRTLNPNTGQYEKKPLVSSVENTNYSYNQVSDNEFIDGVFVPDGSKGPIQITSREHDFNCPSTSGIFNRNITVFYEPFDETSSDMMPALFNGIVYGSEKLPCVLLHSNIGITIDLDRIRKEYNGANVLQLKTKYGLTWADKKGRTDFFVLVDGVLEHEHKNLVSWKNSQSVTIELQSDARFLTFIVTDDQESLQKPDLAYQSDFFYLLEPKLIVTVRGNP